MKINNLFVKIVFILIFFVYHNNLSYCSSKDIKNYKVSIKIDTKDIDENKEDDSSVKDDVSKAMEIIKFIPGISLVVPSITCLIKAKFNIFDDFSFTNILDPGGAIANTFASLTAVGTVSNISSSDAAGIMALQEVFSSNLYCKYQKIYDEEDEYISKSKADNSEGGYPIFPIYPMVIPIKSGQCKVGDILDKNFKQMNNLNSSETRCSFSFSATDDQCLKDISIPILTKYKVEQIATEVACIASSLKKATNKSSKKVLEKKIKNKTKEKIKEATEEFGEDLTEEMKKEIEEKITKKFNDIFDEIKDSDGNITKNNLEDFISGKNEAIKNINDNITNIEDLSEETKKLLKEAEEAKEFAEEMLSEVKKAELIKAGEAAGTAAATTSSLFTDDRMIADPINLMALLMIQTTVEIVVDALPSLDLPCIIAKLAAAQTIQYIAQITITAVSDSGYNKAKNNLPLYKFCGHKWLSYDQDWDYDSNTPTSYPRRGANEGSYYGEILDKIKKGTITNDVTNKQFREYIYGGMEYSSGIPEKEDYAKKINGTVVSSDYDTDYCIDPRDSSLSGINYNEDISQRYYMRGNDKGNFACNRFYYDGRSPCIVPEKEIIDISDNEFESKELITTFNDVKYYEIVGEKAIDICTRVFDMARKCCKYRSKHLICLEKINNEDKREIKFSKFCFSHVIEGYESLANSVLDFLKNKDTSKYGPTCELDGQEFEATKKINTDYVCIYSYGLCPYNFKLNAGLNYKASFCDGSALEDLVTSNSYLQRSSTHVNAEKCNSGLFSNEKLDEYMSMEGSGGGEFAKEMFNRVKKDMGGFYSVDKNYITNSNIKDFELIYKINKDTMGSSEIANNVMRGYYLNSNSSDSGEDSTVKEIYDVIPNSAITTDFYGKIKNLCQYRAHCVEVEKEEILLDNSNIAGSLFLDSSCSGKTSNSRNFSPGHTGNIMTQFSSPVVECIFESFKNLLNGVAGISLCKNNAVNNSEGYCGLDDENDIDNHIKNNDYAYFESKYQKIDGTYIIKGQKLPDSYNPFYKLQKYLLRTIKAAFALFLVAFFYKKLLLGDLESFTKPENIPKLVFFAFKFSIVIWLIFYNGWQQGVYDKLVNFATASYSFVNNIFVRTMENPRNQMINFSGGNKTLRVVENDYITKKEEPVMLCMSYNIFDNVTYSRRNKDTKRCEKGFYSNYNLNKSLSEGSNIIVKTASKEERRTSENIIISNNQELSQLIYYVDKYNDKNSNKLKIQIKVSGGWSDLNGSDLWNKNYDGCYFDTTEYKDDKSYLASFDTLDCKLSRYLGYSVNMAAPNILIYSAIMLIPSFFFPDTVVTKIINGIGSFIFGLMMTFIFMIFNVVLKAIYVFTSSFFSLSVLILLSPIILPLMFFERTKNVFDNWLEYIADNIFKPVLNFASLVIYVNLMDIVLLRDSFFNNHSSKGRGANLICPDGSSSFVCLINGIPGIQQIKVLANSNFYSVLLDIVIVFLFFKLSDQVLTDIENIAGSIFKSLSGDKQSSSALSATGTPMGKTIGESVEKAIDTGKKLEEFRHDYINNAPGALLGKVNEVRREIIKENNKANKTEHEITKENDTDPTVFGRINKFFDKKIDSKPGRIAAKIGTQILATPVSITEFAIRSPDILREKRDQFLNRTNSLANYSKRLASSKVKAVKDWVTSKDYYDYKEAEKSINDNKKYYNDNVKDDIARITQVERELEELRKERINNQTEDLEKKIKEKEKELNEALEEVSDDYREYRDNLKSIKNKVRGKYRKKLAKKTRNSITEKINKFNQLDNNEFKEEYIKEIAEEMNLLDELSEDIPEDEKEFLRNNINILQREDYQNQPTSFDKEKKKNVIKKVKNNLNFLKKLEIEPSDEDKDFLNNLEDENS